MFLQLFSFLILEPTARDTNWHLWFGLLLKEENNHITEEHVNTAQCSEVNRHSWANRTHRSRKLPQVKWFICYGHCSFFPWCSADLTVMSVSWLPFFSFITWSVQPGGRYGEASALSPEHTHTHTHPAIISCAQSQQQTTFKCHRLQQYELQKLQTSKCAAGRKQNILSGESRLCVSLQKNKLITGQKLRSSTPHGVFQQEERKKKNTFSRAGMWTQHRQVEVEEGRGPFISQQVNNMFPVVRVNCEHFTVQEFIWGAAVIITAGEL